MKGRRGGEEKDKGGRGKERVGERREEGREGEREGEREEGGGHNIATRSIEGISGKRQHLLSDKSASGPDTNS